MTRDLPAESLRLRYLLRLSPNSLLSRERFLGAVRSLSASVGGSARNPKWTSKGALEVDIFVASKEDFKLLVATLEPISKIEFTRNLNEAPSYKSREETVAEARGYFNSERFWEAHETLEGLWRVSSGNEKLLLQGLILVCAAFVHHQKGEGEIALGVLRRGSKQLAWPERRYEKIDLQVLRQHVEEILRTGRFFVFSA